MDNNKNINIVIRDFKSELVNLINESGLPVFLIYEILNGLTLQLNNQIQSEIDALEKQQSQSESEISKRKG